MKAIILGQKRGIRKLSSRESYPSILKKYGNHNDSVMSSLLSSLKDAGIRDIVYVGGYHIEKVIQEHNDIKYYYYKKWDSESDISALMEAKSEFNTDILVLQSDVVFRSQLVKLIAQSKKLCGLGVKKSEELAYNEKIKFPRIIQNKTNIKNDLYFAGLAFLSKEFINENFDILTSKTFYKNSKSLVDWLHNTKIDENTVDLLDVGEYWSSVYAPLGMAKFIFGTKAQTLERIRPLIAKSKILPQFSFTVRAWENSESDVIKNIINSDFGSKIVIRSSSKYEDSWTSSQAGKFHSELNVDASNKILISSAINKVIESYFNANCYDLDNEILVQSFFTDIKASGVVFGCDMDNLSPYYIVNSDSKSRRSDTVTSGNGESLDTKIIYNNFDNPIEDKWHDSLLSSVKEIQRVIDYEAIDIEFIVAKNEEVYILQVRPLILSENSNINFDEEFEAQLDLTRKFYKIASTTNSEINSGIKLFSNMSDWNPAEMIGIQPKPLQSSIYQILITNDIWALARFQCGYRKVESTQLMHLFSGKPYIDVTASFSSFIPDGLSKKTANKVIGYAVEKLKNKPELHDKIEFHVMPNCYNFSFEEKLQEMRIFGLTEKELKEVDASYKQHTDDLVKLSKNNIDLQYSKLEELNTRIKKYENSKEPIKLLFNIRSLLDETINYGTLPFAVLARYGFFAMIFLKGFKEIGIFSIEEFNDFLSSIPTVASKFSLDQDLYSSGELSKDAFIEGYGHLRPNSYDICSSNYRQMIDEGLLLNSDYVSSENSNYSEDSQKAKEIWDRHKDEVSLLLKRIGFKFKEDLLFDFICDSIVGREYGKYIFTMGLNLILERVAELGNILNLSREEMSYICIQDLLRYSFNSPTSALTSELKHRINYEQKCHSIAKRVKLPSLIRTEKEIYCFDLMSSTPNFITNLSVEADIVVLNSSSTSRDLSGKIVLIQSADPGYDWIFNRGIKGLITEFGGAASHMAIRSSEFQVAAAIGCGQVIFKNVASARRVILDCESKKIIAL